MQIREGNEHLVQAPTDFKAGDLVLFKSSIKTNGGVSKKESIATIDKIITFDVEGVAPKALIRPTNKKEKPFEVSTNSLELISRPDDITKVTDEDLDSRLTRLHELNYKAPVSKSKKAKSSTVKATKTGKKSTSAKVKEVVKTGKVTGSDLSALEELLAKAQRGEL